MKRHSTDLVSLVFGLIFLAASGWWLAGQYVHIDVPHLGWITAAVLIGLGLLGLLGSLRGERPEAAPASAVPAPVPMAMSRPTSAPPGVRTDNTPDDGPTIGPDNGPTIGPDNGPDEGPQDAPSTDFR
jgi:hypothetical protein